MQRGLLYAAAILSLASFIAPPSSAQGPAGSGAPAARSTESTPSDAARRFVQEAAIGDMFEIESSRLAVERSGDAKVKAFAEMMIDDHGRLSAQLKQTLQEPNQGVPVPGRLDEARERKMAQLRAAQGTEFDRLYLQMQSAAHEEALALHKRYAAEGDHTELRSLAETATPIVERHLTELRAMSAGR